MNGDLSIIEGEQDGGHRDGKLKVSFITTRSRRKLPFKAIRASYDRGESLCWWVNRTQADFGGNLRSGVTASNVLCWRIHGQDLRQ